MDQASGADSQGPTRDPRLEALNYRDPVTQEEEEDSDEEFTDARPVNKMVNKLVDLIEREEEQFETPRKRLKTSSEEME